MIKIAICDDEMDFVSSVLNNYIEAAALCAHCEIEIETFSNSAMLIQTFSEGKIFDIVILDIEMPGTNGKETAKQLRRIDNSFFLIFVSSYPEQVFDTLKYRVNAFIPKTSCSDFYKAELRRVLVEYSKYSSNFEIIETLDCGKLCTMSISTHNILGFYIKKSIIYMKTVSCNYILKENTFRRISSHYIPLGFFECCRNYLVNIRCISSICDDSVTMINNDVFPVSRRNYKGLLSAFNRSLLNEVNR